MRQRSRMKIAIFGVLVTFICMRKAHAQMMHTPYGDMDQSCVHEIPAGARVDATTGDIMDHVGKLLSHFAPCTTWHPPHLPGRDANMPNVPPNLPGQAFWYDFTAGHAINIGGMTQFNEMETEFTVPDNPNVPANDKGLLFIFSGLTNLSNPSDTTTGVSILQPVLQWGSNGITSTSFGGEYWSLASWGVWNGGSYHSPNIVVKTGDQIQCEMYQYAGSPDAWAIVATDITSGPDTQADIYNIPNSWPKYNWAQVAVLEGYGSPTADITLNSCSELPAQGYMEFNLSFLSQGGPGFSTYNNVLNSINWQDFNDPQGWSPNCSWSQVHNTPLSFSILEWSP